MGAIAAFALALSRGRGISLTLESDRWRDYLDLVIVTDVTVVRRLRGMRAKTIQSRRL
jgi:hypothetical protein